MAPLVSAAQQRVARAIRTRRKGRPMKNPLAMIAGTKAREREEDDVRAEARQGVAPLSDPVKSLIDWDMVNQEDPTALMHE
jgi:hypothetical protein